jgi:putative ABC transport system permease protein
MESLLKDLRFAVRMLRRQRAFTLTASLTLALGIGASTAIFSVVEATLLRPLPFRTPERLVFAWGVFGPERDIRGASYAEALDWRRMNRAFEDMSIYDETTLSLRTEQGAVRVDAEMVSASYFQMVGATPQLGRTFTADEDVVPNANAVVVLSDAMWRSRFGGDPTVVGRSLVLNDVPFTVVGILQPRFAGISFDTDVWFPAAMTQANGGPANLSDRGNRWLGSVGRLKDGITIAQAQDDADRIAGELAKTFPEANANRGIQIFTLRQNYLGSTQQLLLSVFAAVGLLLLIACANVAGLQLVRSAAREREMALRQAIGAARSRLLQQLIVEGVVLSAVAAVLGILIANWGLAGLLLLVPEGTLPLYVTPAINLPAFLFAMVISLGCGVLFGLVPSMRGWSAGLVSALKDGSRGSSGSFGSRFGPQQLVVVAQSAFALLLLVGAGLFVRSLKHELSVSLGFNPENVKLTAVSLPARYTPPLRLQFAEQLAEKLKAIPSVEAVAIGQDIPMDGSSNGARIYVPELQQGLRYFRHAVAPDFFDALGIPRGAHSRRAMELTRRPSPPSTCRRPGAFGRTSPRSASSCASTTRAAAKSRSSRSSGTFATAISGRRWRRRSRTSTTR